MFSEEQYAESVAVNTSQKGACSECPTVLLGRDAMVRPARGHFKTDLSIASCRRDEKNLRTDVHSTHAERAAFFGIRAN